MRNARLGSTTGKWPNKNTRPSFVGVCFVSHRPRCPLEKIGRASGVVARFVMSQCSDRLLVPRAFGDLTETQVHGKKWKVVGEVSS